MESILKSIKKFLGVSIEDDHFDPEIIMHINSVFMDLWQLGVGPYEGFEIEDDVTTWQEFLEGSAKFNAVKSYIELRVKLLFDPPSSSAVIEAYKKEIDKWEWRLNVAAESDPNIMDQGEVDSALAKIGDLVDYYMNGGKNGNL